ncbi:MAG TPA: dihydrolipoamide acetyltransferase family protein [Solirubrobacterales bacterium]|nr:dihydrolipoamide acetyltransferase family protein [Solirubrobacterales bacterium]
MTEIVMPRLSDSMEEGTILTWLKQVGDEVAVGDELVEIETDKANMAYEADVAGTLNEILAQEGETLPIGSPIARIGAAGETVAQDAGVQDQTPQAAGPVSDEASPEPGSGDTSSSPPTAEAEEADGARVKASPLARRLAKEKGLDLSQVAGSGPGGRVVKADVEKAGVAPAAAPAPSVVASASTETAKGEVRVQELTKAQQVVARRMAESKAIAPHFYLTLEIDMSAAVGARKAIKAAAKEGDVVPSFNDMVVKACAIALTEFPKANGAYKDGRFEFYSRVNVGVAVAAEEGLVVPTVFDADKKGLRQIAADTRAVAAKVREGTVTPPELSGGTFTVSNLGMFGIEEFGAVINQPQAGILAVGAIREAPAVRDGELVAAQLMKVTLSCDHRILYGAEGAEFLARVRQLLEEPVSLAL